MLNKIGGGHRLQRAVNDVSGRVRGLIQPYLDPI